jgi:transglutaminase-like putative cysteine protease
LKGVGLSPLLGGRYSGQFDVEFNTPVVHWRQRLLWPVERPLEIAHHGTLLRPSQSEAKDMREWVWELWNIPAVKQGKGGMGVRPFAWVQLSEYKHWRDVARWAARLFAVPARSPQVEQVVRRLEKTPSEETRFLATLRFVQDEVRSIRVPLSTSSGPISSPDEVLFRRMGDAKDKALLLLTLLHALGFEARAALVNTDSGGRLETWHPSPRAFNHVIVRAIVGGQAIWVDPLNTHERGPLASRRPLGVR